MTVRGINHINIRTLDIERSKRFYEDLLDLNYSSQPVAMGHHSHWLLDADGLPIIHFRLLEAESASTGPIDHVALNCAGLEIVVERLKRMGIDYAISDGLAAGLTQIFVKDPHGVSLELNFQTG